MPGTGVTRAIPLVRALSVVRKLELPKTYQPASISALHPVWFRLANTLSPRERFDGPYDYYLPNKSPPRYEKRST